MDEFLVVLRKRTVDGQTLDREALIGAILTEASLESSDRFGSWDSINKKQKKCKWKNGIKPDRDEWLGVLQKFLSADCVSLLEVQSVPPNSAQSSVSDESDDVALTPSKRRKVSTSVGDGKTDFVAPSSTSMTVELVERSTSSTKVFPFYRMKLQMDWPQSEFFNAVATQVNFCAKFKNSKIK